MTQGDDSGNPAKLVAWRCFGVYKSCCWDDGAKGSDLEGRRGDVREWVFEMEILVLMQLLVMTRYRVNHGHGWLIFGQRQSQIFRNKQVEELSDPVGGWHVSSGGGT